MAPGEIAFSAPSDSAAASAGSPVLPQVLDAREVDLAVVAGLDRLALGDFLAHAESVNLRARLRDHRHMHLIKGLRDTLGIAAAMLGLVLVAGVTFALAIWAAAATVVP